MSLILEIKVTPSSSKQRLFLDKRGLLACWVKNPPEHGKANDELLRLLSKALGIAREKVTIVSGSSSRKKVIKINTDISRADALKALGLDMQQSMME